MATQEPDPERRLPDLGAARTELPDDFEDRLAEGREALEFWPRDAMYENDKAVLDMTPSRAEVEAANRDLEAAQELLEEMQRARYEGADPEGVAALTIDLSGSVVSLDFGVDAGRAGNHGLSTAITAAWGSATRLRAEDAERLNRAAREIWG
ncbi:hypothetical protein [Glycomyces sp. NRRL B-16210]|uniref:hypothetical protein n=1 Tax=Glycomyces sp. NRRL B-16210 TaxID=1463821 RepID=UPI0004BF7626|nr:hypothetical protein [Glycomyces sp. NRRL B-16210]